MDYGETEDTGAPYLVMEYVQGITMRKYIKQIGKIPPKETAAITLQILSALSYAYSKGIQAHRDIKPENIMININAKQIKVMDFGIAKTIGSNLTHSTVLFTPHYASPEQLMPVKYKNKIDKRSDIYSLGIVIYEMLTGKVPFNTDTPVEITQSQLDTSSDLFLNIRNNTPKPFNNIILRCVQPNPEDRFQTPEEMIEELKHSIPDLSSYVVSHKSSPGTIDIIQHREAPPSIETEETLLSTQHSYPNPDSTNKETMMKKEEEVPYSPWPMFRGNPMHTGRAPHIVLLNKNIITRGILKWKYKTGDWIRSSPAIASDGMIYVGSWDHYLYIINPDGTLKRKYKTGGPIASSVAIALTQSGHLFLFDKAHPVRERCYETVPI